MRRFVSYIRVQMSHLLLLLFFISSFHGAAHIHLDEDAHDNSCEVCIVLQNFLGADIPSQESLVTELSVQYITLWYHDNSYISVCEKYYYAQAPPSFLLFT